MAPEIPYEDRCGSYAVTVIVSVHEYLAAAVYRIIDDIDSLAHVIIKERIVPDTVILRQKLLYGLSFGYSAILKQYIKERISIRDFLGCR
jgi:hypothetical protein